MCLHAVKEEVRQPERSKLSPVWAFTTTESGELDTKIMGLQVDEE